MIYFEYSNFPLFTNGNSKLFEGHLNDLYDFANIFFFPSNWFWWAWLHFSAVEGESPVLHKTAQFSVNFSFSAFFFWKSAARIQKWWRHLFLPKKSLLLFGQLPFFVTQKIIEETKWVIFQSTSWRSDSVASGY